MKDLLFDFEEIGKGKTPKTAQKAVRAFVRAGQEVKNIDPLPKVKRAAGVSYRELTLTMGDGQTVTARIKQTGDIYQVLLNGKVVPIKNQDDHTEAIKEISAILDAGRKKFQKALAAATVKLPPSIKTAAPKQEQLLIEKRDNLKVAIEAAKEELASIQADIEVRKTVAAGAGSTGTA